MVIEIKKRAVIVFLIVFFSFIAFSIFIPTVSAPIWYGSGDNTGLVGRWSCEGNFNDRKTIEEL